MIVHQRKTKGSLAICHFCEEGYWANEKELHPEKEGWTEVEWEAHKKKYRLPKGTDVIEIEVKPNSANPTKVIVCLKHAKSFAEEILEKI